MSRKTESGKPRVLAIITARGGSKGLPKKNLRELCGRPLVQWSIDVALNCTEIDEVIVSTDDNEIAEVSLAAGAKVPFLRPSVLASDTASSVDVVIHAINFLEAKEQMFDVVLLLEPTSPLRDVVDIQTALNLMTAGNASAIVSVGQVESTHPQTLFRVGKTGRLEKLLTTSPVNSRRQDLEPLVYPEGSLYASSIATLKHRKTFYHEDTLTYKVSKWKALEVDDIEDFQMIEAIAIYKDL